MTAQPETALRVKFRARVRVQCPAVQVVGIPNAGKRGQWAANQAKREGLAPGFPDDLILIPGGRVLLVEWKTAAGRLSLAQVEWQMRLRDMGFDAMVASDPETVLDRLRELGAPFICQRRAA